MKLTKGHFTCSICKKRFWDELEAPDKVSSFISFCLDCGHKMGLDK